MDDTLEYLHAKLEDERTAVIESLADGNYKTFEEYKYATGFLRGLLLAQATITDLAKRMENSDE